MRSNNLDKKKSFGSKFLKALLIIIGIAFVVVLFKVGSDIVYERTDSATYRILGIKTDPVRGEDADENDFVIDRLNNIQFKETVGVGQIAGRAEKEIEKKKATTGLSKPVVTDLVPDDAGKLIVHFIDVGQGDAILIRDMEEKKNILIDTGEYENYEMLKAFLSKYGIDKIDVCVGTHPHSDHIGSMASVIRNYGVEYLYIPNVEMTTTCFEQMLKACVEKDVKLVKTSTGGEIELGNLALDVLAPDGDTESDELNDYSIVLRMSYGSRTFMFMGDAEELTETEILESGEKVGCDVLKVGHHGSTSSSSDRFLNESNPVFAVIEVGEGNDHGHPHHETVESFAALGTKVYRTDENGTVTVATDGKDLKWFVEKAGE